jgi:hypothetical protein
VSGVTRCSPGRKEKSKSNAIFRITDALLSLFPGNASTGNQMNPHTWNVHPSGSAVAALPVIREMILICEIGLRQN